MRFGWPRGVPIFWQTLMLLIAGVAVVQCVSFISFLSLPPPRFDFNRLSDIAESLSGREIDPATWRSRYYRDRYSDRPSVSRLPGRQRADRPMRDRALAITMSPAAPTGDPEMVSEDRFTERLADQMDVPVARVRLFFQPDQRSNMPFDRRLSDREVVVRRGEPLFFNTVVAGLQVGDGWRIVRTPPRDWLAPWQKRMLLLFTLSAIAVIPGAWWFARRLTRPIRRIAEAADLMGSNRGAPPIVEEGPAELRVTAHALNRMQESLSAYLAERTNMIGAIAHDLRTPLARIAFRIEGAPDELREKVQGDIEQMRAMIAATISFVRDTARISTVETVQLADLLRRLCDDEQELGRPVVPGLLEPVVVLGDGMALSRLFQNLIDNGIAYGGSVEIVVRRADKDAEIRISDRGPGLPAAKIEQMFKPFERGEPSRNRTTGGIGLGLSIARAIAQEHGGTLILTNREGGGMDAICRLPAVDNR
jgi:two-component system OmpR family sensor kinase